MALTKTKEEIDKMRRGGAILSRALKAATDLAAPGVTLRQLDEAAEASMRNEGAEPSFKGYTAGGDVPFPSTVCISVNEIVCNHSPLASEELVSQVVVFDILCLKNLLGRSQPSWQRSRAFPSPPSCV